MRDVPATFASSHKSRFLCQQTRGTFLPFLFAQRLAWKRRVLLQIFGTSFVILLAVGFRIEREIELIFPTKLTCLFPPDFARYLAGLTVYLARPRRLGSKHASIMPSRIFLLRPV